MKRALLHIPAGLLCAALVLVHWSLTFALCIGFLHYEQNEDHHISDQAFKDIMGFLWGLAICGIILLALAELEMINEL